MSSAVMGGKFFAAFHLARVTAGDEQGVNGAMRMRVPLDWQRGTKKKQERWASQGGSKGMQENDVSALNMILGGKYDMESNIPEHSHPSHLSVGQRQPCPVIDIGIPQTLVVALEASWHASSAFACQVLSGTGASTHHIGGQSTLPSRFGFQHRSKSVVREQQLHNERCPERQRPPSQARCHQHLRVGPGIRQGRHSGQRH